MEAGRAIGLTDRIIHACIAVHRELGPGFLETIYHQALRIELGKQGIPFETEREIKVFYQGVQVGLHRLDLVVGNEVVVELKTVEDLAGRFYAQVRSYLKAANLQVGLLVNFSGMKIDVRRVEVDRK
ncbi:MAG: GxxExxY protein [Candidatus Riflebacteria bacterium]|nr:GxxExxY protein [Candidatus Riflebacteria bacterium]